MNKRKTSPEAKANEGYLAQSDGVTLRSWTVGALPIVNRILEEMRLEEILQTHLPQDGPRMTIPTSKNGDIPNSRYPPPSLLALPGS